MKSHPILGKLARMAILVGVQGGLPFPGTGCPVPDVGNIYLVLDD